MTATCTRLTKRQQPCGANRAFWAGITAVPDPQACRAHLTLQERAAYDEQRTAEDIARQNHHGGNPACWDWPAPADAPGDDWSRLVDWHDGRCALCGRTGSLVEDHDHATGLVRGYLCPGCNTREGIYGAVALYQRYRARSPAHILGVAVRYLNPITGQDATPVLEPRRIPWADPASKGIGL